MSNNDLEKLLQKSDKLTLENYEVKNSMTNIFSRVVEFVQRKTELESKRGNVYLFTPKMLHEIFEENNSKYFADLLWQNSTSNSKIGNRIAIFESPRRSVYQLRKVEKKSEVKTS